MALCVCVCVSLSLVFWVVFLLLNKTKKKNNKKYITLKRNLYTEKIVYFCVSWFTFFLFLFLYFFFLQILFCQFIRIYLVLCVCVYIYICYIYPVTKRVVINDDDMLSFFSFSFWADSGTSLNR